MTEPLLAVRGLRKSFGGIVATDDLDLEVMPNEIHAVIGPNGAGKTTLIAQLTGALPSDGGRVHFAGRDITRLPTHARSHIGLARSFQITSVFLDFTALDNVALAVQAHAGHSFRFWRPARRDPMLREPAPFKPGDPEMFKATFLIPKNDHQTIKAVNVLLVLPFAKLP